MMKRPIYRAEILVKNQNHAYITFTVASLKGSKGSDRLIENIDIVINGQSNPESLVIEPNDEVILKMINTDNNTEHIQFIGFIDNVTQNFEHDPANFELVKNEVVIRARSFASILTKKVIRGIFHYSQGCGELVKRIGEPYGFDTKNVKLNGEKGTLYFKGITILEAFRRMAYMQRWCLYFRGKSVFFEPWHPPEDSGITLTDDNMIRGSYSKGFFLKDIDF